MKSWELAKTDVTVALNDGREAKATRKDVGTTNMGLTKDDFTVTLEATTRLRQSHMQTATSPSNLRRSQ